MTGCGLLGAARSGSAIREQPIHISSGSLVNQKYETNGECVLYKNTIILGHLSGPKMVR